MRKLIVITVILCTLVSCKQFSSKPTISLKYVPVKQGDYWGYIDHDGKMIINPQFKEAYAFKEGLALIKNSQNKYGFIDETGKIVINAVYVSASPFNEGLAPVAKENQKIEYIDKDGKTVLSLGAEVEYASQFYEGLAITHTSDNKDQFITTEGKIAFNIPQFEAYSIFSEGLVLVRQKIKDDYKYGYVDKDGKVAITPQFDDASMFKNEMASFKSGDKYGFINKQGKIVITPQFDRVQDFAEGMAAVKQGELWGFVNKEGKLVINPQFKRATAFNDAGLAPVQSVSNEKWGFINKDGKIVVEPQFESATNFYDDVSVIETASKYGLIDTKGKYLVNPIYDDVNAEPRFFGVVESDYFDIGTVTSLIYKNVNPPSIRGISRGTTFSDLQTMYSDLNHYNYDKFEPSAEEKSSSLSLETIHFYPKGGFYYYDAYYNKQYNDNTPMEAIEYEYNLRGKARSKSNEIVKKLVEKTPAGYSSIKQNDNALFLKGDGPFMAIQVNTEKDKLYLWLAFDNESEQVLRKSLSSLSDMTTTDSTTTDSQKEMIDSTAKM